MKGISRVPWVRIFLPWRQIKRLRRELRVADNLAARQSLLIEKQDQEIAGLQRQLRIVGGDPSSTPSSQKPDFVLVGIPRPGQGVRVIASRELAGTEFTMTAFEDPPPRWLIKATMSQALMVDKPSYPAAMARIGEIWRNWDREHGNSGTAWGPSQPLQPPYGGPALPKRMPGASLAIEAPGEETDG